MEYAAAKKALFSLAVMGSKFGTARMRSLMRSLGNPQEKYKVITVAGSNGKGSTANFIAGMLAASGLKAGCYTSPHLDVFEERIRINGKNISRPDFSASFSRVYPRAKRLGCTFFEVLTAVAFDYYARKGVDVAVLEVGLGGRLDATNIADAQVAVITSISLDHTHILGGTIGRIAWEKAGIIKRGSTVVMGGKSPQALAAVRKVARKRKARLVMSWKRVRVSPTSLETDHSDVAIRCGRERLWCTINAPGRYQLQNAASAICAVAEFMGRFDANAIRSGLENASIPGRLETVSRNPLVIMDCAHNPDAFSKLLKSLEIFGRRKFVLVFGAMRDKDIESILWQVKGRASHIVINSPSVGSRALKASEIEPVVSRLGIPYTIVDDPYYSVRRAKQIAGRRGMVVVAGSMYMLSQARHRSAHVGL
ncbi:MAG: folylpolyglutamate synthase/dihydrofolate synthase family protein [Candidatus Micrarchaeia archaeon]